MAGLPLPQLRGSSVGGWRRLLLCRACPAMKSGTWLLLNKSAEATETQGGYLFLEASTHSSDFQAQRGFNLSEGLFSREREETNAHRRGPGRLRGRGMGRDQHKGLPSWGGAAAPPFQGSLCRAEGPPLRAVNDGWASGQDPWASGRPRQERASVGQEISPPAGIQLEDTQHKDPRRKPPSPLPGRAGSWLPPPPQKVSAFLLGEGQTQQPLWQLGTGDPPPAHRLFTPFLLPAGGHQGKDPFCLPETGLKVRHVGSTPCPG